MTENFINYRIVTTDMFEDCVRVIRSAFITVADDLKLTKENAATNPAFIEIDALNKMHEKNIDMFAVFEEDVLIGFVAIEKANDETYYMEKLAILPEYRHKGYGKKVMDFVVSYVKDRGGKKISIGIINENVILKKWYSDYGFQETEIRTFNHLPFMVCLMEKAL